MAICLSACNQKHVLGITREWCAVCRANRAEDEMLRVLAEMNEVVVQRDELLTALKGVVRVADRQTAEFDTARAAIAKTEGN